jgi:hypothetical protein
VFVAKIIGRLLAVILAYAVGHYGFEVLFNNGVHFEAMDDLPGFYFLCVEVPRWVVPTLQTLVITANLWVVQWLVPPGFFVKNKGGIVISSMVLVLYILAEIGFLYTTPVYRDMFPYNFMESCNGTGFKTAFWDQQKLFYYALSYGSILPIIAAKFLWSKSK